MDAGSDEQITNSIMDIKKYFSTSDQATLTIREFQEFWESLTEEEKDEFKKTELR